MKRNKDVKFASELFMVALVVIYSVAIYSAHANMKDYSLFEVKELVETMYISTIIILFAMFIYVLIIINKDKKELQEMRSLKQRAFYDREKFKVLLTHFNGFIFEYKLENDRIKVIKSNKNDIVKHINTKNELKDFIHSSDRKMFSYAFDKVIKNGNDINTKIRFKFNKNYRIYKVIMSPIFDVNEEIVSIFIFLQSNEVKSS